jgi:hypothetical protein
MRLLEAIRWRAQRRASAAPVVWKASTVSIFIPRVDGRAARTPERLEIGGRLEEKGTSSCGQWEMIASRGTQVVLTFCQKLSLCGRRGSELQPPYCLGTAFPPPETRLPILSLSCVNTFPRYFAYSRRQKMYSQDLFTSPPELWAQKVTHSHRNRVRNRHLLAETASSRAGEGCNCGCLL